jgi:hypothetical protein
MENSLYFLTRDAPRLQLGVVVSASLTYRYSE